MLVKVLVGGTGVLVFVEVLVKVLVGGTGVLVLVKVGVLVLVAVGVLVLVGVFVLVGVEPPTVTQELVAPMALQMPVTAALV